MEGKRLSIDSDPSAYPGMRLFQKKPFESNQEGERVICDYIELIFSTKIARGPTFSIPNPGILC